MNTPSSISAAWKAGLAMALAAGLIAGCGGGGGGGGGGSTGSTIGTNVHAVGQFIEFIGLNRSTGGLDPLNLHVGDSIQLVVANYDGSGNRTVLDASGYTLDKNYNGISLSNGLLNIQAVPETLMTLTATASVAGTQTTVTCQAWVDTPTAKSTVTGTVTQLDGVTPLDFVEVIIYDQNKNVVGGALSFNGGKFTATVDSSAYYLTLNPNTLPTLFYKSLDWNGNTYALAGTTCLAKVQVPAGGTLSMGDLQIPQQADGPPPPPTGCFQ